MSYLDRNHREQSGALLDRQELLDRPIPPVSDEDRHSAALTVAEHALAEHWSLEALGDVLDALGLGGS